MQRPQEILNAAAELFHHRGYHATTVEEIAGAVGLKKGGLYHYISSKDVLLQTLAEETIRGYLAEALAIAKASGTAPQRLGRVITAHIARLCAAPERVTVLVREAHYIPHTMTSDMQAMIHKYTAIFSELIGEGIAAGEFAPADPQIAGLMLLGALNWTHRWYQAEGRLTPEEIGQQCSRIFIYGLGKRSEDYNGSL